jgi:threonylcarbamoyladenosine tRNA methylthiotransferase MtaB
VFGADIIAGFPTETEDQFQRSLDIVDECDLTFLHVFPFSPRKGTPAARMPQLPGGVAKARAKRLRDKGQEAVARHLNQMVGRTVSILMERARDGMALGRCGQFTEARMMGDFAPGDVVMARITGHDQGILNGEPI